MRTEQHYDIAIIGDGITGLSAAFHLQRLGASGICVLSSARVPPVSSTAAGLISGGFIDNITRLAHRHGVEAAASIWDWTETAFDRLLSFAEEQNIATHQGARLRWLVSADEEHEAEQAVGIREQLGLDAELISAIEVAPRGLGSALVPHSLQLDGTRAAFIDPSELLACLRKKAENLIHYPEALRLEANGDGVRIETEGGSIFAEAAILANHLSISRLVPALSEALVPYADQWHEWSLSRQNSAHLPLPLGSVFSWRHGHYWGGVLPEQTIRLGGARFLRPLAGFEATEAPIRKDIQQHLKKAWEELYPEFKLGELKRSAAGLDCWPSDELPLVGPMFGEPRLLLATGFMGQGLSMGFYAGCCLAELVQGLRPPLPRLLWPERLRNLPLESL